MKKFATDREWADHLARPRRILIVEDDEAMRRLYRIHAEDYICELIETDGGQDAIEEFCRVQFDPNEPDFYGVFLDLRLKGDRSGIDVFREICRLAPKLPVIIVSAYVTEQLIQQLLEIDMVVLMPKQLDARGRFFERAFSICGIRRKDQARPLPSE